MQNISIGRFDTDPEAQGVVKPADGRWQLVVDKDGYPHLYIQCNVKDDTGQPTKGMFLIEELLPDGLSIRELMEGGEFEGGLAPEEEQAALDEWVERKARLGIPCPKM